VSTVPGTTSLLVLRRGGLGDTLLTIPLLRALRRAHPDTSLHFAGVREFAEVLHAHGAVDEVLSSEDVAAWSLATASGAAARRRLRRHSLIVADDPALAVLRASGPEVRVLDLAVRTADPFGLQLARSAGVEPRWPDDSWLAPPRPQPVGGPVVLAPGSGGRHKCWPRERWVELAHSLGARGERIAVVVGPAEIERDDPRRWPWGASVTFVAEPVVGLAHTLRKARAFVGNDSGPSHLAACVGVPTIVLFGPTDPRVWSPVGGHVRVVAAGDLAAISVEQVDAAVDQGSRLRTLSQ